MNANPIGAKAFRIGATGMPDPREPGRTMESLRLRNGDVVSVASSGAYSGKPQSRDHWHSINADYTT